MRDLRVPVIAPHALEEDRAARLELSRPNASEQDLLVERDHEIGLIAAVRDLPRAQANAVSTRAGDAARGRLDLGRNDLDGPYAVPGPRRDRPERLAAALRPLTRVADHLDDVLVDGGDGLAPFGDRESFGHAIRTFA